MAIRIGDSIIRNIQEQVQKNKSDIAAWKNVQATLDNFGIKVLGTVDSEADIPEATYTYGDAWLVGEETPYDLYIFTRDDGDGEFVNIGPLAIEGPQGPAGTIEIGTVSTGEAGTDVIIENIGTSTNAILNITIPKGDKGNTGATGAQGVRGEQGETGPQGLQGLQGIQGPQGDPGESFMIIGSITNVSQLPDPTETPRNYAYILKDGDPDTPDDIYYISGTPGNEVWSYSTFAASGTTVSVSGNPVSTWNADTKLDKNTTNNLLDQVYVKYQDGVQGMIEYNESAVASAIVKRTDTAQIKVPTTPVVNADAASKFYVDKNKITAEVVEFNQLVQNGDFKSTDGWSQSVLSIDTFSVSNNQGVLTSLSGYIGRVKRSITIPATHRVFMRAYFTSDVALPEAFTLRDSSNNYITGIAGTNLVANTKTEISAVVTPTTAVANIEIGCNSASTQVGTTGNKLKFENVIVVDLSAMGLELLTLEQCQALFNADYYPYTSGTKMQYIKDGNGPLVLVDLPMEYALQYSTAETKVGTWINGKPIYRKVMTSATSNNMDLYLNHHLYGIADNIWINNSASHILRSASPNESLCVNYFASTTDYARCWVNLNEVRFKSPSNIGTGTLYVVLEYTKSAD